MSNFSIVLVFIVIILAIIRLYQEKKYKYHDECYFCKEYKKSEYYHYKYNTIKACDDCINEKESELRQEEIELYGK